MSRLSGAVGSRPKALLVSPDLPYPMRGGGAIRSASIFEYLTQHYDTDVLVFREMGQQPAHEAMLQHGARRAETIWLPLHSRGLKARIKRNLRRAVTAAPPLIDRFRYLEPQFDSALAGQRYDLALVEHFWLAPYLATWKRHARRVVLDLHNVESVWHERTGETTGPRFAFARWAQTCVQMERHFLPQYDDVLVTSDSDAATVRRLTGGVNPIVYPNALRCVPTPELPRQRAAIFTGNLEYAPNVTAALYFQDRIWPQVRSRTDAVWQIAGMNWNLLAPKLRPDDRVHVLGEMTDAVETIGQAVVSVVPLQSGSGTRLKIVEAWAAATAVVSTAIGAEGLPGRDGVDLLVRDEPGAFADAVVDLLSNEGKATSVGRAGRQLYEDRLTWPSAWASLSAARI